MSFINQIDIANRACQHCRVRRIDPTIGFTEDSEQSIEISFAYDKVRRAELRRNIWRFAVRKAALRPLDVNTMLLVPPLWASTTTYAVGAIVADANGYFWQSRAQDNLNHTPGNSSQWEAYCGPMTVSLYDTTATTAYFAGELVYETPGDGTYTVYMAQTSGISADPRQPTTWIAATQYMKDQVVQFYPLWLVGTTYAAGNGVTFNSIAYVSLVAGNVGNEPDLFPTKWVAVPVGVAPGYYSATVAYTIGQFVTYLGLNYVAIAATTGNLPTNASFWAPQQATTFYVSLIDFNLNNLPSSAPALWASGTTYSAGASVGASDGNIYTSIGNGNVGNNPTTTTGFWTNTNVLNPWTTVDNFGTAGDGWQQITVGLTDINIIYPLDSSVSIQNAQRRIYRLPANYLRIAPQDPKAGSVSFLGAPTGLMYKDWNLEGNFFTTREAFPIIFRFVADITQVPDMDDMFCEGFAARIAVEVVGKLSQAKVSVNDMVGIYRGFMGEARTINGIETGPTEPPEDDFITCRI